MEVVFVYTWESSLTITYHKCYIPIKDFLIWKSPSPFLSSLMFLSNNMTFVISQQVLSNTYSFCPLGSLFLNKPYSSSLETESVKHIACSQVFQCAQRCFLCYVFLQLYVRITTFPKASQKILITDDSGMAISFHCSNHKHNSQNY